jgi:hypothetical protein
LSQTGSSRSGSFVKPRKWMIIGCLIAVAVCFGPSPFVQSPALGLVLVCIAIFFLLASYQYQALIVALAPAGIHGSARRRDPDVLDAARILAPIVIGAVAGGDGQLHSGVPGRRRARGHGARAGEAELLLGELGSGRRDLNGPGTPSGGQTFVDLGPFVE